MRRFRKFLVIIIVFVILALGGALGMIGYLLYTPLESLAEEESPVEFTISKNESLQEIATRLASEALVRSARLFLLYTRFRGTDGQVPAGTFMVERGKHLVDFHDDLMVGQEILTSVLIPEGATIRQIARRLEKANLVDAKAFEDYAHENTVLKSYGLDIPSLQGFLFPDTYYFSPQESMENIAKTMVEEFFKTLAELEIDYTAFNDSIFYNRVVMASIVEREYRVAEEAPLIASVFYNRLEQGMRLQSCATIVFVITEEEGNPHPTRLFFSDLERTSLYNTYLHQGPPPTPIASPGREALSASFFPADTDYLFFVVNPAEPGTHTFTTQYSDHLVAAHLLYIKQES